MMTECRCYPIFRTMLALSLLGPAGVAQAEEIDASDPTKIYTYAGPGFKHTEFSNGDSLSGLPAFGINQNWALYLPPNHVVTWGK